jgi:3-phosphoshikimate 1-carboxyvinyltransferase
MDNPLTISPISHPLDAMVRIPGSKSLTNRALLIAALAKGTTRLSNALFSDDSYYVTEALLTLGFDVRSNNENAEISVTGQGGAIPVKRAMLFIGNAGTAARFLSAFLTLGHGEYIIDGEPRMRERPIADLAAALRELGAQVETGSSGCPPVRIGSTGLHGGRTAVAGDISSQFLSALLMVAPYADERVEIVLSTELNSKPYIDMTLAVMRDFGVEVEREGYNKFSIPAARYHALPVYPIESDASAASYFFAAPAVCGGTVRVKNITRKAKQGDIAFLNVLEEMGCTVSEDEFGIAVSGTSTLRGVDVDMRDFSDTAQTLAVVAPFATSPTRIRGIASSRLKETDRVKAVCTELARLGVHVEEHTDGMTIYPCKKFRPAVVQTYKDHRMAMAFSLIGLRVPGVAITDPGCVSKTFPDFFSVLTGLG